MIVACKVVIVHVRIVKKEISEPAVIVFPSQYFGKACRRFVYEDSACSLNVIKGIKGKWKEIIENEKDGEWDHDFIFESLLNERRVKFKHYTTKAKTSTGAVNPSVTKEFLPVEGKLAKRYLTLTHVWTQQTSNFILNKIEGNLY